METYRPLCLGVIGCLTLVCSACGGAPRMGLVKTLSESEFDSERVNGVAFSQDGKFLATAGENGLILWSTSNYKKISHFAMPQKDEYSPCDTCLFIGDVLVVGRGSKNMQVWDYENKKLLHDLSGFGGALSLARNSNGKFVFSGHGERIDTEKTTALKDYAIRMWDLKTGTLIKTFEGHRAPVMALAISPDDKLLLSSSERSTVRLWDVETGNVVNSDPKPASNLIDPPGFSPENNQPAPKVTFLADGKYALDGLTLWDLQKWERIDRFSNDILLLESITSAVLTPDGTKVLCGHDRGSMSLWDVTTGKEICRVTVFPSEARVRCVAISKDGKHAVACGEGYVPKGVLVSPANDGFKVAIYRLPD